MSRVLLDTNVISELVRPRPEKRVVAFVQAQPDAIVSALVLHEIAYGAERVRDSALRVRLTAWVASIRSEYAGRIVEIDADIAEQAGRWRATAESNGVMVDPIDAIIAACAASRGATVATRNVRDFAALGVTVIDPWTA
ncbi:MAG: PIN domain-containing protein [Hyphomonadaceae bacterium]